jgi:hypothetical protein
VTQNARALARSLALKDGDKRLLHTKLWKSGDISVSNLLEARAASIILLLARMFQRKLGDAQIQAQSDRAVAGHHSRVQRLQIHRYVRLNLLC